MWIPVRPRRAEARPEAGAWPGGLGPRPGLGRRRRARSALPLIASTPLDAGVARWRRLSPSWVEARLWPVRAITLAGILLSVATRVSLGPALPGLLAIAAAYVVGHFVVRRTLAGDVPTRLGWCFLVGLDLLVVTGLLPFSGMGQSPVAFAYLLPTVVAGVVLGLRAAIVVATVASAAYLASGAASVGFAGIPRDGLALVVVLYGVAVLAALVAMTQEELRRQTDQLAAAIVSAARGADQTEDLGQGLGLLGERISELVGASSIAILVRRVLDDTLSIGWQRGAIPGYAAALRRAGLDVVRTRRPERVRAVARAEAALDPGGLGRALADAGLTELRLLPIVIEDRVVGRVDLGVGRPVAELDRLLRLAEPLLHNAGLAILRDRRMAAQRRRTEAMVRLHDGLRRMAAGRTPAVLVWRAAELCRELTGATSAAGAVWNDDDEPVCYQRAGDDGAGRAPAGPPGAELLNVVSRAAASVRVMRGRPLPGSVGPGPGARADEGFLGVPLPHLGGWRGALTLTGPPGGLAFADEDASVCETIAAHLSAVLQVHRLYTAEADTHDSLLRTLVQLSEAREHAAPQHADRVAAHARRLARHLGVADPELGRIAGAARLHDIGTLLTPDQLLAKSGPLSDEERQVAMAHGPLGADLVQGIRGLAPLAAAIRHHHERWDGAGYPDGLAGDLIPLAARIIAVADALETMTVARPHRAALPLDAALAELGRCAGTQFDPLVVEAAVAVFASGTESAPAAGVAGRPVGRGKAGRPVRRTSSGAVGVPAGPTLAEQEHGARAATAAMAQRLRLELRSSVDVDDVARRVLGFCRRELGLQSAALALLDERGQQLVMVAGQGPLVVDRRGDQRPFGQGLGWAALEAGAPVVAPVAEEHPRYAGQPGAGRHPVVVIPITAGGTALGVLVGHRPQGEAIGPFVVRQLEAVAAPIGPAIRQVRRRSSGGASTRRATA